MGSSSLHAPFLSSLIPTLESLKAQLDEVGTVHEQLLQAAKAQEREVPNIAIVEQMFDQMPHYQQKLKRIQTSMADLQRRSNKLRDVRVGMEKDLRLKEQQVAAQHARAVLKAGKVVVNKEPLKAPEDLPAAAASTLEPMSGSALASQQRSKVKVTYEAEPDSGLALHPPSHTPHTQHSSSEPVQVVQKMKKKVRPKGKKKEAMI